MNISFLWDWWTHEDMYWSEENVRSGQSANALRISVGYSLYFSRSVFCFSWFQQYWATLLAGLSCSISLSSTGPPMRGVPSDFQVPQSAFSYIWPLLRSLSCSVGFLGIDWVFFCKESVELSSCIFVSTWRVWEQKNGSNKWICLD